MGVGRNPFSLEWKVKAEQNEGGSNEEQSHTFVLVDLSGFKAMACDTSGKKLYRLSDVETFNPQ